MAPIQDWSKRQTKFCDYLLVWAPEHPKSFDGGWYYLHRVVVEKQLNRILHTWETVHHINEDKYDCSLENLFVCTRPEHDNAVWLTA